MININFQKNKKKLIKLFKQNKKAFFAYKNISTEKQKSLYWKSESGFIKNLIYAKYNLGRGIELAYSDNDISGDNILNQIQNMLNENTKFYEGPDFITDKIIKGEIIQIQAKMRNATINLATITNGIVELSSRFIQLRQILREISKNGGNKVSKDADGTEEQVYSLLEKELMVMFGA